MRLIRYTNPNTRYTPSVGAYSFSPWAGLESEIDRVFQSTLGEFAGNGASDRFPVDIYEDKENTYVRAELPGVERSDINVEIIQDHLNLTAARKTKDGEKESSFSVSRSVSIPEGVHSDKVVANYENGVLTVTLPKKEESKPRKIAVSVN